MRINIDRDTAGITVFDLLKRRMHISSRSLRRLKYRDGGITVNGESVTVRRVLSEGDVLVLDVGDRPEDSAIGTADDETGAKIIPRRLSLDILYEDGEIILINKAAGMPTHPSHGHLDDTLANALAFRAESRGVPFVFRPVNRLDRNTSGIVLAACDCISAGRLFTQMRSRQISKTYIAVVCGVPNPPTGVIDTPIAHSEVSSLMRVVDVNGSPSLTEYNTVRVSPDGMYSLVVLRPRTGRTHQIRVHMASIGNPLLGDFLYGEESPLIPRHALHAARLEFAHPTDGRLMIVSAPLPDDMTSLCRLLFPDDDCAVDGNSKGNNAKSASFTDI